MPPVALAALVAVLGTLIGISALRAPALTLFAVVALGIGASVLRDLATGIALFIVLSFFEGIPGAGQSVTAVKLASALLLLTWLGQAWAYPDRPLIFRDSPVVAWLSIAFVAWAIASTLWAADAATAASGASRLAQMLFLTFLIFSALRSTRALRLLLFAYVGGAVLSSLVGLASGSAYAGGAARFRGDFGNPNNLAAVLLPAIALAGFGTVLSRRPLERRLLGLGASCSLSRSS